MCVNIFIQWLIRNSQVKCMRCRVSGEFIKVRCRVHVYGLKKCMFEPSLFGNKNLDWNSLEIIYFHLFFFLINTTYRLRLLLVLLTSHRIIKWTISTFYLISWALIPIE